MMPYAEFVSGAIAMGFLVCAVFFVRFWTLNKDSFFLVFAVAFFLLALNQGLGSFLGLPLEERSWLYLLRLAAFSMIIIAIVRQNFRK
ncbi:MAG: DUF5985 family protein [Hyphomonadaceae bacterium]